MPASLVHFFHPVLHGVPSVVQGVFDGAAHGDAARQVGKGDTIGTFMTVHEGGISSGLSFHMQTPFVGWDFRGILSIVSDCCWACMIEMREGHFVGLGGLHRGSPSP